MRPQKNFRNFRSETRSENHRTAHTTSCRRTADVTGTRRGPAEAERRDGRAVRILTIPCAIPDQNFCGAKKFPKFFGPKRVRKSAEPRTQRRAAACRRPPGPAKVLHSTVVCNALALQRSVALQRTTQPKICVATNETFTKVTYAKCAEWCRSATVPQCRSRGSGAAGRQVTGSASSAVLTCGFSMVFRFFLGFFKVCKGFVMFFMFFFRVF